MPLFAGVPAAPVAASSVDRVRALAAAGRHAEAESLATRHLHDLDSATVVDSLEVADLLSELSEALDAQGRWEDGAFVETLHRALGIRRRHLPPGHPEIGVAALRLAEFLGMERDLRALPLAREALEIFLARPEPVDSLTATAWVDVGQLEMMEGNPSAARDALAEGLRLRRLIFGEDHRATASAAMFLGEALLELGDPEGAQQSLEASVHILDRIAPQDDVNRSGPISRLQAVYLAQGDLARAIDMAREAARLAAASGNRIEMFVTASNLGMLLREFGDHAGACRVLGGSLAHEEALPAPARWLSGAYRQVYGSVCLQTGELEQAQDLLTEAERILRDHPSPDGDAFLALTLLAQAEVHHLQGRYADARTLREAGIRLNDGAARPDRTSVITARGALLRDLEKLGDGEGIAAIRDDLAAACERWGVSETGLLPTATYWLARADHDLSREAEAWAGALLAEEQARQWLVWNAATLPESRALELGRRVSPPLNLVLMLADERNPGRWRTAWDRVVRTRGLIRAEVARRRLPGSLRADPELSAAHATWVEAQRALARRIVHGSTGEETVAELDELRAAAERTESERARLLRGTDTGLRSSEVGLEKVLEALPVDAALLAFKESEIHEGSSRLLAFVARGGDDGVVRVDLGPVTTLEEPVAAWIRLLATAPESGSEAERRAEGACRDLGERVRELIWDPVAVHLGQVMEIALVPDGPVLGLPWHALPVGDQAYLVDRGFHLWLLDAERELLDPIPAPGSGSLLALGNPDFSRFGELLEPRPEDAATVRSGEDPCRSMLPASLPDLPGTEAEAQEVSRLWAEGPTTVLVGESASETAFRELAPRQRVVHLATHGVVSDEGCADPEPGARGVGGIAPVEARRPGLSSPWLGRRVWLVLSPDSGPPSRFDAAGNDGLLTAEEAITLDLSGVEWVVLSACHSGLVRGWASEGAVGMQRALRVAGARSILASRWALKDVATADWMRHLYAARAVGERRASAASESACRALLAERRAAGRPTHPFYWAAFTVSGR